MPENNDKLDNPNGNPKDYRKAVEERVKKEREDLAAADKKKGAAGGDQHEGKITSKFVQQCLAANELGDGILYAAILKDKYIYNKTAEKWLSWSDHYWNDDVKAKSVSAVEKCALKYLEEAEAVGGQISVAMKEDDKSEVVASLQKRQENIHKRVWRIRSDRGRINTLKFAHTNPENPLDITSEEFGTNPYLFACRNGVIDLRTGKLRPGRQNDFISKASSIEYPGVEAPAPNWELALKEMFDGDQSLVDYLGRLFGYCITGLTVERFMPIFYGSNGFNGKTTIVEIISHIMGSLAAPIQAEMLLDQGRVKSSGAATPEIMGLCGLRLAFASETDQGRRFSTSKVKWLIGSDSMTGRYLYDKRDVTFKPTHKLLLLTNHKPDVSDTDDSFWGKIHLIPFPLSFVLWKPEKEYERPANKYLREKLLLEAPGILSWIIKGCLQYQEIGLAPPPAVIDATKEYRRNEDLMGLFVDDCCYEDPHIETPAKDLYEAFKKWWESNVSRKVLSQKRFGSMLLRRYKRTRSGTYRYFGIGLKDEFSNY